MKIQTFGAEPDMQALLEVIKHIPANSEWCYIKTPERYPVNAPPCRANLLVYEASVDNKVFITVIQKSLNAPYEVKVC